MLRLEPLQFANLGMGRVEERVNQAIERLTRDVCDRPEIDKARTITIKVEIRPRYDKETKVNMPTITSKVSWSVPGFSDIESVGIVENGAIKVNMDDGENPLQGSLLSFEDAQTARGGQV